MTERLHFRFSLSCIGEGNGNPLQCSCLENPRDGGAWWAAVYGVAQSRTPFSNLPNHQNLKLFLPLWHTIHFIYCWYLDFGYHLLSHGLLPPFHPNLRRYSRMRPEMQSFSSIQSLNRVQPFATHELQHARPACPSPTPRIYSNSCPSSRWCHPAILSSVIPSCISEVIDISPGNLDSSLCFFQSRVSHDVLCIYKIIFQDIVKF